MGLRNYEKPLLYSFQPYGDNKMKPCCGDLFIDLMAITINKPLGADCKNFTYLI
jgi:hypothetical protein